MFSISLKENTAFVKLFDTSVGSDILASIFSVKAQIMLVLVKYTSA